MNLIYTFQNSGEQINNDVVLPGAPFRVEPISYNFLLKPQCKFWRFGIRFSRTDTVQFYMPEHRYKKPEFDENFIDIHIGVGQWEDGVWRDETKFHLAQYNLDGLDHLLTEKPYVPMSAVGWSLNFEPSTNTIVTYFEFNDNQKLPIVTHELSIPREFKFFKVFAWADKSSFQIDCEISINSAQTDLSSVDFRVGNIIFRKGNMFDYSTQRMANVFILPASSSGTATPHTLNRASELGIPNPKPNLAGSVELYPVTSARQWMSAGYGYAVNRDSSSLEIVAQTAMNLHDKIVNNKEAKLNCRAVSLPLLGTGTGRLDPILVASTLDQTLNAGMLLNYVVSIPDGITFLNVKRFFIGRYDELGGDENNVVPNVIIDFAKRYLLNIDNIKYDFDEDRRVSHLSLEDSSFTFHDFWPGELKFVTHLSFNNCKLNNLEFLKKVNRLKHLKMTSCSIVNISALEAKRKLYSLELSNLDIESLLFLISHTSLRALTLRSMHLKSLSEISILTNLEELDLRSNEIDNLNGVDALKKLRKLFIATNRITSIQPVKHLKQLEILDISNNLIQDLTPIAVLKNLKYLRVNKNPAISKEKIILDDNENQLLPIQNMLQKKAEEDLVDIQLPCKILLLGNHGTGKSSLLNLLQKRQNETPHSTHIIKIEKYPTGAKGIPKAIFFDFGGQDYYHGLYKAFLSGGSAYLLLFNLNSNENKKQSDSNKILTQDFSLQYWLNQKKYFEQQVFQTGSDPIFIIQTYADKHPRLLKLELTEDIQNIYYVNLIEEARQLSTYKQKQNSNNLNHLIQEIKDYIDFASEIVKRPRWFVTFVNKLLDLSETSTHEALSIERLLDFYDRPGDSEQVKIFMQDDLDQLHKQGLVLYYKDHLPDIVWLNPVAVVNYVHDKILIKSKLLDRYGLTLEEVKKFDQNIVQLLHLQKVLFYHEYGQESYYIVPNFLPLFEEEISGAGLLMFGMNRPCVVLKFINFLPFGLINQLICFFGVLPEHKRFWRDKLLFKLGKTKVCIDVDMQLLEIKIFTFSDTVLSSKESDLVERYIFLSIMGQYWDMDILSFNDFSEFEKDKIVKEKLNLEQPLHQKIANLEALIDNEACRPLDLYISKDNKNFVSYSQLCGSDGASSINAYEKSSETENLTEKINIVEAHPFQVFTKAKLKKAFKAVISYSKQDLDHVLKFRQYLEPLREQGLLDRHWFCTLLLAGEEWNEKIKKEFDEADIIFFMVSENLMSTQYVKENEIKNAIDKYDKGGEIFIIPILLVPYNFKGKGKYDLTRFSSLPYSLKPITEFRNQHIAWHVVSELIRITLERNLKPETTNDQFYPQLDRYLAAIINGDKIADSDKL
ncbi:hypothetical protein A3860_23740 [Niastella vici]|uniref:TIR domain-containing protein n=1 Tax=Niastella vici TaxID=1703345 RepID=A0A1V9FYG0_9BACT|nr:leucine-rich repeat domain-containing protein [Niastella vici]OQP63364.1 hypothetical protein A3860_23740 [Niastella vici]